MYIYTYTQSYIYIYVYSYINLKPRMGQECTEHYVAYIARQKK